jgi:hypothetical protein
MALQAANFIPAQDKVTTTKGRKGGGKWGTVAGLAAGAALGALTVGTGGAAAPLAMAALSGGATGAGLGGMIGEAIRPTKEGSSSIERRLASLGPQMIQSDTSQKLRGSLMALHEAPPAAKQQYAQPLLSAYMTSLAKDNQRA